MAIFTKGQFTGDDWHRLDDADAAQDHALLTLAQWQARSQEFAGLTIGILLEPGVRVEDVGDLSRFSLIALDFPKYTDGRGFSMARQLRALGFAGEIRAVGNVLFDQLQLMARCGFDSFEITHDATLRLLESGRRPDITTFYQPGLGAEAPAGTRPWIRKRAG
ncbi:MAG: DUF934 domain-containing protein [Hyphomicrobiales bacterium]|nr:DUF934 domain-containing protein [Hyphomicrobiales bacterium]